MEMFIDHCEFRWRGPLNHSACCYFLCFTRAPFLGAALDYSNHLFTRPAAQLLPVCGHCLLPDRMSSLCLVECLSYLA